MFISRYAPRTLKYEAASRMFVWSQVFHYYSGEKPQKTHKKQHQFEPLFQLLLRKRSELEKTFM